MSLCYYHRRNEYNKAFHSALDELQVATVASTESPFTLCTLPEANLRWSFRYPEFEATLTHDGRPVCVQLISVIRQAALTGDHPYLDIMPYYHHDAAHAFSILNEPTAFDPELDVGACFRQLWARNL